jgi:hypothetical protein
VKSLAGSYCTDWKCGATVKGLVVASATVYPSGLARASCAAAIVAPAPGLFSTTTGTFQRSRRYSAIQRAEMSPPPAGGEADDDRHRFGGELVLRTGWRLNAQR